MNAGPSLSSVLLQGQKCPLWETPRACLLQRPAWEAGQAVLTRTHLLAGGLANVQAGTSNKSVSAAIKQQRNVITAEQSHKCSTVTAEPLCQHQFPFSRSPGCNPPETCRGATAHLTSDSSLDTSPHHIFAFACPACQAVLCVHYLKWRVHCCRPKP